MHVLRAERHSVLQDDVGVLLRTLSRFRWRLGCERAIVFGLRGLMASAVVAIGLAVADWLLGGSEAVVKELAWLVPLPLVALPLVAALGVAVVRWPSERQAALAADRRLALDERLGTAVELARRSRQDGRSRRFDQLQIHDAIEHASAAPPSWLALDRRVRRDALGALLLAVLALGSLLLPNVPRPSLARDEPGAASVELADLDMQQRALPFDAPEPAIADPPLAEPQPRASAADLANRVQQAQAERGALDTLAQALGRVSAGQPAAEAIQQGDFAAAKQQLASLGEEADQLSDAAKQQLARALQQAANATNQADRQLADRERQAAQALSRSNYADQRQALRNLADQVERSGARSVPADQLARDMGQLQQQQSGGQGPSARGQSGPAGPDGNAGAAPQAGATGGAQGGAGLDGQPGGAGVGTGAGSDALGDTPSRLDSAGQQVTVPLMLGSGSGVRPPDGSEDQTGNDPTSGARSVAEQVQAQQTGQIAPERNLVPSEQRPVVRGYFK